MKLYYNSLDISALGEISIKQSREMEGGDQPQRAKVRLEATVDLFLPTYDQNRAQIDSLRAALLLPNAVLQWTNDAVGVDYVNQTAVVVSEDLPEEWGQYHQTLHLVFAYYEQAPGGATNNLPLTFSKEGSAASYQFDVVNRWQHSASTERFSTLRKQRRETRGKIHVEGQVLADGQLPLAQRRTNMAAAAAAMTEQMNSAEGVLQFGQGGSVFNGMVRIEEFTCDLDQLVNAINFSFTCSYTLFPDESAYATAEFTMEEHDNFTGELVLTVAGKIQSQDEAGARVKLAAVFEQVLTDREYLAGQQLSLVTTPNAISANEDGDTFTELSFSASWRKWERTNQMATVLADGHQDPVPLGNVTKWADRVDSTRFSPLHAQRERTTGVIEAGGTLAGDPTLGVVDRRAQLLALQRALKEEVTSADEVTLAYGDWTQVLRVNSFTAEINQAETGIDWSLSADYILFPNLASYATATYTITERDNFTGELHLAIAGRVQAQDAPAARVKMAAILQQALTDRNFKTGGQVLNMETTPNVIDDNEDGATFTELSFSVEYRKWKKSNLMATFGTPAVGLGNVSKWQDKVSISRFNPLRSLRERSSDTIDAAGTLAGDPNLGLADRRAALLVIQRKLKAAVNVPDGLLVYGDFKQVVRVTDFTAEINQAETGIDWSLSATYNLFPDESNYTTTEWAADQKDNFTGETTLTLSGKIQAATLALGANREAAIDGTAFLRGSTIRFDQRQLTQNSATEFLRLTFSYEYQSKLTAGRAYMELTTHVSRDTFGVDVETCSGFVTARDAATTQGIYAELVLPLYEGRLIHSEQTGFSQTQNQTATGFNEQDLRMEFNIQVYSPKLEGEVGMRYSVEVTRDFLTLEMRTALEGSCFALDRPTADTAVAALMLALNFGSSVRSRRHEDRETTQPGSGMGTTDVMLKLDFQEDFVGAVTGQAGVNEMKLTEKVVYSATRWGVQNLPFESDGSGGVSIPQPSGVEPGSRTVSGSVTAGTLATAQAWTIKQRALLTGDALGGSYPRQEEWETDYEFVPRIDGIATGRGTNVRLYRVSFQFGEILPLYPKPA